MCWNPNIEEILANIFIAFSLSPPFAFFRILDANIAILELGPYIASQYTFKRNDGQRFRAENIFEASYKSLVDKLSVNLFIFPTICDNLSKLSDISSVGIKPLAHFVPMFLFRFLNLRDEM